jgi:hypothetical protein
VTAYQPHIRSDLLDLFVFWSGLGGQLMARARSPIDSVALNEPQMAKPVGKLPEESDAQPYCRPREPSAYARSCSFKVE